MIIFAVDSSSCSGSAAVWRDGEILAECFCNIGLTHSETLMPLCDQTLRLAGVGPDEIDLYAVTAGPGSFTGLRIGMGIVKGMAFVHDTPCVGVPTLEALAWGLCPCDRLVLPVLDARRRRVYAAGYDCGGETPRPLFENELLGYDQLAEKAGGKAAVLVGDAARLCYTSIADAGNFSLAAQSSLLVRAGNVAAAAKARFDRGLACGCGELAPIYIQLPQAERERLARQTGEVNK